MADWEPDRYLAFARDRERPLHDLVAAIDLENPETIVDLGCGPGNSTEALARRWPDADLTGIDTSPAMLDKARARLPSARFVEADAAAWQPDRPVDLIFANAVLHWLPDHATLLSRLMAALKPGGVLAVQFPDNQSEPSHRALAETAVLPQWRDRLGDAGEARTEIGTPDDYFDWLDGSASDIRLWRTVYVHRMRDHAAIVGWIRGAGMTPYLKRLDAADADAFIADYAARVADVYRARADGSVLFPFPRMFILATRA